MKYLLIDGNNLAVRCAFANENLTNRYGIPTGVLLFLLRNDFPSISFLSFGMASQLGESQKQKKELQMVLFLQVTKRIGIMEMKDRNHF